MAKRQARKPKETHDAQEVIQTTMGVIPAGQPISVPYAINLAPKAYSSWVFAAASIRANAVASVPLRLYTRSSSSVKAMGQQTVGWVRRPVPKRRKRYLMGMGSGFPHSTVVRKSLEMDGDMEEVIGSPASELLRKVNPWQGGFELLTLLGLNLNLTGMCYWYCDRSGVGGTPSLIMNLAPKSVEVVPGPANFIEGYMYGRNSANPVALSADEVVYFRRPNPDNPWYGKGFVEAAWAVIQQNAAVHEMDTAFFRNYARPDYLAVIANTNAKEEQLKRFRDAVSGQVGGKSKTGRMLTVTGDVDIKPLSFPPKDLSGRDEIVEEIGSIFGIPISMLKANDPNLASAKQGYQQYRENSVAVDCRLIEDVLNQSYLKMWGLDDQAFFAFDNPLVEDEAAEATTAREDIKVGVLTLNDRRAEIGFEPYENPLADQPLFNGQPIGAAVVQQSQMGQPNTTQTGQPVAESQKIPENATPTSVAAASDQNAAVQDTALNGAQVSSLIDLVARVTAKEMPVESAIAVAAAAFPLMTPEQVAGIFNPLRSFEAPKPEPMPTATPASEQPPVPPAKAISQKAFLYGETGCSCHKTTKADSPLPFEDDELVAILNRFVASLEPVLKEQAEAVLFKLDRVNTQTSQMIVDVQREITDQKWVERIKGAAVEPIARGLNVGAETGVRLLPENLQDRVSFDYANPEVQRYVDRATTQLATGVNETTSVRVRDVLGNSLTEGKTIPEIREQVKATMQVDGARAEMIARTETAKAYTQGQLEAWKQTDGLVTGKRWVLAPDACEFCRAAARMYNETPKPLGEPFFRMGETLQGVKGGVMNIDYQDIDGPPLHPNDRCSVNPVVSEG